MKYINPKYSSTTIDFNTRIGRQLGQWDCIESKLIEEMDDCIIIESVIGSELIESTVLIQDVEDYCMEWLTGELPNYATESDQAFLEWLDLMPSKELAHTTLMASWYKVYKAEYYENLALIQQNKRQIVQTPTHAPSVEYNGEPREF